MPAAPAAAESSSMQQEGILSENWPEEVSEPSSSGSDRLQFSGDGLNTGVRVLGANSIDSIKRTG
jgi:hypothetical protein